MDAHRMHEALVQIQMEYREMPDLKLTLAQARRLFAMPAELCEQALEALVRSGFLRRTSDGAFLRLSPDAARTGY